MFKSKKAYLAHPVFDIIIWFVLGMVAMYLIARGIIPVPLRVC